MPGIYNCDWFSFTADFTRYYPKHTETVRNTYDVEENKHLAKLFSELDEQRERSDGQGYINLGLWSFHVRNHGNRSYYYLLENDDMEIYLMRYRSTNEENYPVYVHFKSQFLWSEIYSLKSISEKYRLVIEWLEDVLNGKYLGSKINRCDLAYHTDEMPDVYDAEYYVGKHTLDTTRRTHRIVSSIDIGSRKSETIFFRSYNKYLEVRQNKKQWFFEIWLHHGMNVRKVWNFEFQLKREFFKECKIGRKKLDSAEDVIENQTAIWKYLTTDWVSYRIPDGDRRTRWPVHPWWKELANYHECKNKISREKQRTLPTIDALIPGMRGYLSSYAAHMNDLIDGTLFERLRRDIEEYDQKAGKSFEEVVDKKRQILDPELANERKKIGLEKGQ